MNVLKKVAKKVENSKIVKNPKFLVIGLIIIVVLITLIYFIFLKYSPIMNFKYEGYAISGKEITENLLGSGETDNTNANKNIELTKIEEQGTIFKKLNDYFVGSKEKTEINLNYPIYINGNSSLYNLSEGSTLISRDFEEVSGYPNLSISEGKIYDGNNLERADAKEYIFVKTTDNIYINLYEIKVKTTANEYTIPVNSIIAFAENSIRYYSINNNVLVFNQINDIDDNSNVEMVENGYTYKELLTRLGILQEESNNTESSNSQENIIQENTANEKVTEDNENKNNEQQNTDNNTSDQNGYIKPEVRAEDFTAEVYTAKSTLHIKDPSGRIIEAPIFEIYKDGKIYLRRTFSNSGEIQITGLIPDTEYEVIGKYIYLNENNQKVENTFYEGRFTTKGYEELGSIDIQKENGEIFSNKIQITKVKITSDLNAEVLKGVNQVEIETGEIRTVLSNSKVISLLRGEEITLETSGGLESDSTIKYTIKFYDKNGIELKVNNGEGETKTSKEKPTVRVNVKEQDIVNVTLGLKLTNRDNVELENYKYVVTRPNGEVVQEKRLSENESELLLEDLDQNQYYKISIYADYDLNDNRGKQEQVEIGNLVFATQPISTLGSLELTVENKELTSTTSTISYKIDEERTDKRLIQILNELTINIVEQPEGYGDNNQETKEGTVIYTDTLTGDEITNLQQAGTKEIKYENLKSNTAYTIEITGNVQLGNTQEEVPITYNYKEFTTLKNPAKVEIRNQFVTGNLIDFDVRIEDIDNSVLNNTVRMELREENNNLISLEELETNQDYVRKTYEKLEENKKYKLRFIADQYNEGNTDATYKANYLIKEIEIITEPGVSGEIQLTDLKREGTGKNLIDVTSKVNWRGTYFNVHNNYGKEYNAETNELRLYCKGDNGQGQYYLYDLSDCIGQTITMSFEIKKDEKAQIYISNKNTRLQDLTQIATEDWQEYQYTTTITNTGLLGFEVNSVNNEEAWMYLRNVQIELGDKKTSYEAFKYNLKSTIKAEVEDKRNEIESFYIQKYKNNELVQEKEYSKETNVLEDFQEESNSEYRFNLVIKINGREYILDSQEFNTENDKEIKGINSLDEYLNVINPEGNYIVFCDLDFSNINNGYGLKFTTVNYGFSGIMNFNGNKLIRDTSTSKSLFNTIEENGKVENFVLDVYMDNEIEISGYDGLFSKNYGILKNFKVVLEESTNKPNIDIRILGSSNFGRIENFILEANVSLYGTRNLTLGVSTNYGIIKNGYAYGENIKGIYPDESSNRNIGVVIINNSGTAKNIFSLINVDVNKDSKLEQSGNIISYICEGSKTENLYSVGYGENYILSCGPTIGETINATADNVYYFADITFNNSYNRKTTPLALWDTTFQNQILNSDNAFNVYELVTQGYYPQLNWPDSMPTQEYIELPEVEDKDLPDILSMEILESTKDTAKVKFSVNNPSAETITNITIENLQCTIESQEYNEGKSEVIATLNNPVICVSQYSVMSISTKGAYNQEYTRDFAENERLIDVDFYREINTTDDWKAINNSPTENYILMQDLDFRNNPYDSVISTKCTGIIDGNNHTIRNIENNRDSIVLGIQNEVRNIYFENISFLNAGSWAGIISTVNKLENVHANNVKIVITKASQENITQGGLVAHSTDEVKNCSVNNVTLVNNTFSTRARIGGLIGVANATNLSNCYATNINIQTRNSSYEGVAGLIGASETKSIIKNCYTTGKIEIDGSNVGGIIGYINDNGEIYNSYSYVNITGNVSESGGVVGIVSSGCKLENNIALGNLYSSQLSTNPKRIIGSGTLTATNYAYSNQRLNGLIETTTEANTKLLTPEELLTQTTYTNMLNYGNAYNYSQLGENILPKLHKINEDGTYSNELLPNQEDVYLDMSNEFKIDSVEIEKSAVDQIAGQIVVINTNEEEVTGLEIDGMDVTVTSIITRDGKSYINITAKPNKFYDTYKITKVKYKEEGQAKEQEVEGKIEVQFYKELYNFEDWQEIEDGTYQNYRLMSDIDFAGRTNVKTNVTMARFEAVGGVKTLKNINLEFTNDEETGLIQDITTNISNIKFENIEIQSNNSSNNIGIISTSSAEMDNLEFNNITINSKSDYSGCIAKMSQAGGNNIKLTNVNVTGNGYVGGLIGYYDAPKYTISDIMADNININATGNYVGGILGQGRTDSQIANATIENSNISGNTCVGGLFGLMYNNTWPNGTQNLKAENNIINGQSFIGGVGGRTNAVLNYESANNQISGIKNVGGVLGESIGVAQRMYSIKNLIIANDVNADGIGGIAGIGAVGNSIMSVMNCTIESLGNDIGGIFGKVSDGSLSIGTAFVKNTTIKGNNNVGGVVGKFIYGDLSKTYVEATIEANSNVGGIIGYLDNTDMTAVTNTSNINNNYIANTKINAKSNIGGFIGSIAEELYMPEKFYYSNYVEADLSSTDLNSISLGIGGRQNQNQYLKDTYYYKYSTINGQNPNEQNELFITQDKYLAEEELKNQTTYTSRIKWSASEWNFSTLANNKYPTIKSSALPNQEGINLPKDSEHIVGNIEGTENSEDSIDIQSIENMENPEQTFEYDNKTIQTYSTYSVITDSGENKVVRNAKLYVKDNNLYAIPSVVTTNEESKIVPVANNIILDNYNGKEYETVLGSDGKLYDLKEPITYPENFVNSDIESIGNNLNSDIKEVEVTYKNGDKIKFNYQTGEIISSSESDTSDGVGLFDYLVEKISEIGNSNSDISQEITNKYEESKELQTKLEETSVEEAIEKQNNPNYIENGVTAIENNETNNSLKENKYISMYNEETGQYEIYNEEELLDTSKEEVVSENEKIEANNLSEYYASEGESRNTKMGIVWIAISIIGVGIILIILKKNLKKKA